MLVVGLLMKLGLALQVRNLESHSQIGWLSRLIFLRFKQSLQEIEFLIWLTYWQFLSGRRELRSPLAICGTIFLV
jgi:hypothetical protein